MVDRPILFSAAMVRALLEGRKTQTRRFLSIPSDIQSKIVDFKKVGTDLDGRPVYEMLDRHGDFVNVPAGKQLQTPHFVAKVGVRDRLWVKETWGVGTRPDPVAGWIDGIEYRADECVGDTTSSLPLHQVAVPDEICLGDLAGKWRPSIHMFRWVSRLTLTVTDVRIERLQSISDADAIAEGIEPVEDDRSPCVLLWKDYETCADGAPHPHAVVPFISPVHSYRSLWDDINGAGSWDQNPWIVAYTFTVVLGNIDEVAK